MANRRGKCGSSDRVPLLGFLNHCGWWLQSWNQMIASWQEIYDKPGQHVKKQRHHFADKGLYSQSYSFSSSHVQMWELDNKEGRVLKKWYLTVVLEKTLEGPLDSKEIKPVNLKGNQPWMLFGRLTLKLKLQYFGHLMLTADLLEKTLMLGKIEGRRRKK